MKRLQAVLFAGLVGAAGTALATRPLTIDDADPTPVGQCQLTAGIGLEHTCSCQDWYSPVGLAYGLVSDLEVSAGFGAQRAELDDGTGCRTHEFGCSDLLLGAKWQVLRESDWLPRQTLEPAVKIPTACHHKGLGSGRPDYDLTWVASKKIGDKVQVDVNVGYTWVGSTKDEPADDVLHGGVALEYQFSDTWQLVGEVFGQRGLRGEGELAIQGNIGVRWQVADAWTLDTAIGSRLRGDDAPHMTGTIGLTWLFDVKK